MAETTRPDVTGKGPSLVREMFDVFKEVEENLGKISGPANEKVKSVLQGKSQILEPLIKRPFMKTVKAGEISYDCKQIALELKQAAESGSEKNTLEILNKLEADLDELINRIQTFVVRMT